ncbi:hemerythrin domain-containing protein [Steroidobacter sp.]|uniref:hemerythrin domain-containing protein n=1 Tax=Steroidobacter sp. TaxID=1978227 RepID=UPI001A642603|nr:hemerythrin domain-containing protein [Steroidobacter sp.]MBL8268003.1 hemerythrin domain-containing protein [Steroidobacter sp.]
MVKPSPANRKPKQNSASKPASAAANALELLKTEHQAVAELFDEFESADSDEQQALAEQICQQLTLHAQIEEEILYPAAKNVLDGEDVELVNEAAVEHATVKDLIAKIEAMDAEDEPYKATVKVLSEYVKHHVDEEENELFPLLEGTDLDLESMGAELVGRKQELMTQLGSDEDLDEGDALDGEQDEDESAVAAATAQSAAKSASKSKPSSRKSP